MIHDPHQRKGKTTPGDHPGQLLADVTADTTTREALHMTPEKINTLARSIYAQNVERGWWDDPDRCIFRTLQLVNTEIAEATEGDRKGLQDDHLPHRLMVEVEMADTLIRLLDLAGRHGWEYDPSNGPSAYMIRTNLAAKHFFLTDAVCRLGRSVVTFSLGHSAVEEYYGVAVSTVLQICDEEGYDIEGAVYEKLRYNETRADHSREARAPTSTGKNTDMKTLDEIVATVRSGGTPTVDEMRYAIVAFDVLLYQLDLPADVARLQEYFKAAESSVSEYVGEANSPDNPEAVRWYEAMQKTGQIVTGPKPSPEE